MAETKGNDTSSKDSPEKSFQIAAPTITMPKGGGAIRGMGEKFAANPVTGTSSMTVPIATSPGRSGFGPQLSLSYDSGAGNGPFGFGWSLSLPSITRKTDKGLPRYFDAEESDVFILSGAEDLVPTLTRNPAGQWIPESVPYRTVGNETYKIRRYRPRIEGLFARIERWTNQNRPDDTFWRSISKDNITTWYGKTSESRIFDLASPSHIFSWLICESYDDKGNAIRYEYNAENDDRVDLLAVNERNRSRTVQRYLKHIKYGNKTPRQPNEDLEQRTDWLFQVVFDYGEHDKDDPKPNDPGKWLCRHDPFSSYRAGFEVRTYRLCQRVLMFHHFPLEDIGSDCLVKSTDFVYRDSRGKAEDKQQGNPIASFIASVTQSGYKRKAGGGYLKRSLPPVEFEYSEAKIQQQIREVDADSLENLPIGLDGAGYQWVDLDGEGISGIFTEQADAWFYKRNVSPISTVKENSVTRNVATFAPIELVSQKPAFTVTGAGGWQFQDLAGDGKPDLARFDGPLSGFFERNEEDSWDNFVPFQALPNVNWSDPNLRFVDLTGDGLADVLITEDQAFTWYPSLGETGFAPSERALQALDEERGPRVVFADGEQSIYLADVSGDGLTDLIRIRNGEVCYWPNLGYGRFGAKVTMDNAPWFDAPDLFSQRRIRLADVDGSGVIDILYLGGNGITVYFNQSGNSWSEGQSIPQVPQVDNLTAVQVVDLFGNGTSCLVWSSPLPGDARRPMRYIDLMGGQKPHLLIKTRNNLGAESEVEYAVSTKFYLQDKQAGKPWITKLPFPVHCVEKVTARDQWRQTEFTSTYSYHHGYFDGIEREFRGFGRVEQRDVETYGQFMQGHIASPYITDQHDLYQPPIKTITWYHTGAAFERGRILSAFKHEYVTISGFTEHQLPEPTLTPADLSAEEWREALRVCKGMILRQEVFELDVDLLDQGTEKPVRLYTTAHHNSNITRLQPRGINRHAVFLVTESEAITYNYELDLRQETPSPDPRIAHTLNLRFDKYGRALQTVAVVYPRLVPYADPTNTLKAEQLALIRKVQTERHLAYTETRFTDELQEDPDRHRLPAPCEVLSYELTGANSTSGFVPSVGLYFSLDDLRAFKLSDTTLDQGGKTVVLLAYHEQPSGDRERAHKRIIEWVRMLYFKDNLSGPEPFGTHAWLGLPYETYKLALTSDLLGAVFGAKLTAEVLTSLNTATTSGYIPGTALSSVLINQWWIRSGIAGFANDAAQHFYLPEEYTDPFGNKTTLAYDGKYDLFIQSSTDALGNKSGVAMVRTDPADPSTERPRFDYRILAPIEMVDINGNHTEVYFDVLGMVVASAVKGKGSEADDLSGFDDALANPSAAMVQAFCTDRVMNEQTARTWLNRATARFVYHFGESRDAIGNLIGWAACPAGACGIVRERHVRQLTAGTVSPLQVSLECSDGTGSVLMKKVQAEPDSTLPIADQKLRWIINGLTVLNNKGKPVKQYEPSFSTQGFGCEPPSAEGVTPIIYYDAAGRVVCTEMPDGTYSRVEFSPWHVRTFDANDTAYDPAPVNPNHSDWYTRRTDSTHPLFAQFNTTEDHRAAESIKAHADTPAQVHLDSLGREVIAIAHNRVEDANGTYPVGGKHYRNECYLTFTKLDAEGKPLWICDARGNLVMQYITPAKVNNDASNTMPANAVPCFDIAGNLLFQHSMDAGDRWMLMDAAGKPMLAWDMNETPQGNAATRENRFYRTDYDPLHRPTAQWLKVNNGSSVMVERYEYQDAVTNDVKNLNGQLIRHYDPSCRIKTIRRDFKGNVQEIHRTLTRDATVSVVNWDVADDTALNGLLEQETYVQITQHDALNRMTRLYNWHRDITFNSDGTQRNTPGSTNRVAVYVPEYNERGTLKGEWLHVRASKATDANGVVTFTPDAARGNQAIKRISYNAKGQKEYLELGNGTLTQYDYDEKTFRLKQIRTTRPADASGFPQRHSNLQDAGIVQQLHYTYDPVGNITEIYDEAYKPVFFANVMVEPRSRYEYDALYRLISSTGRENSIPANAPGQFDRQEEVDFPVQDSNALREYRQRYQYDSVGNIQQMRHVVTSATGGWTRDYAYAFEDPTQPASNRLWQTWTGGDRTQAITYGYDRHGNMLNLANVAPGQQLQWDHRDMIKNLDLVGGGIAYYQYDAGKQRARKYLEREVTNPDGTKRWVKDWERIYLGGYELYRRYNGNDTMVAEEIESHHFLEGEQRVLLVDDVIVTNKTHADGRAYKTGPIYRYQYSNHLESSCLELDHEAEIISYEEYHPYGTSAYRAMKSGIEAPPKRYRYTGMERDEESGLGCHGARYYALALGRWVSCDPTGVSDGTNVLCFAQCNPVNRYDRNGRQSDSAATDPAWLAAKKSRIAYEKVLTGEWQSVPKAFPQGWTPDVSKPSQAELRIRPELGIPVFVSELDRQVEREQQRRDLQFRVAAVVAGVGVAVIAPEAIILLGFEGTVAGTTLTAGAEIASAGFSDYGLHGDIDPQRVVQSAVSGALLKGFLKTMPGEAPKASASTVTKLESEAASVGAKTETGVWATKPVRAPAAQYRNGIPAQEGARIARSIRNSVEIGEKQNIAVAEAALDYKGRRLYAAVSGRDAPLLPSPKEGRWFSAGHSGAAWRGFDTEAKILEDIATDLPLGTTGTVNIYTELKPCFSCTSVIEQFQQRFPGIQVNVTWGTGQVSNFAPKVNLLSK